MASPSIDAFTMGILRKVAMTAREMNGMQVSLTPLRCSYLDFSFSRMRTMRLMSILKTVCTWALVRLESTMRWAMMERIRVNGTSSSPGMATGATGGAAGFAAAGAGVGAVTGGLAAGAAGAGAAAPPLAR